VIPSASAAALQHNPIGSGPTVSDSAELAESAMAELVPRAVDGIVGGITNDDAVDEMVAEAAAGGSVSGFHIHLENFEGPFDLLLSLISRRKLDVTEVALSQVTDEFLSYLAAAARWDLGQATEFLVVAATLLDLKTARLLPSADVEDEEDLALLEARDLLFARLLQYRAYKLAAAYLAELEAGQARRHGRSVELEARFTELLPEVVIGVSPARFAALAALALTPKPVPVVATEHVHSPRVSVREHMAIIRELLHRSGSATAPKPWRSLHASLDYSSSIAKVWSASTRSRRWASFGSGGPAIRRARRQIRTAIAPARQPATSAMNSVMSRTLRRSWMRSTGERVGAS
jgi:chromatin segregation and condensation protein Rec8/ScpA/Scc1 (kleisin family)